MLALETFADDKADLDESAFALTAMMLHTVIKSGFDAVRSGKRLEDEVNMRLLHAHDCVGDGENE